MKSAIEICAILVLAIMSSFIGSIATAEEQSKPQFRTSFVPLPPSPSSAIYDPFNGYVYVSYGDGAEGGISVVSGTTNLENITLDSGPGPLLYDSSNHFVYATGVNSHSVTVINGTKIIGTIPASHPTSFTYDPSDDLVYLATQGSPAITAMGGTSVVGYVGADCSKACTMLYDPSNGYLYVANGGSNMVSIIDGTTVKYTVEVGSGPYSLLYNPFNKMVYVADSGYGFGDTVTVINGTDVATIIVGASPSSFVYDPSNGYVYVINNGGASLSVISGTANIANVSIGFRPFSGLYNPSNGYIYVPNPDGYDITIISGTRIVADVNTGPRPSSLLYNPSNNYVYASNSGFTGIFFGGCAIHPSNFVSIISGSTVIENVTVGYRPGALLYNPDHGFGVRSRPRWNVLH